MPAKYENRNYGIDAHVWVGKYRNLHNISHWHLEYELVACQAGMVQLMINGHCFPLCAGDAALCPGGSVHYINSGNDAIALVAQFGGKLTESITGQYQLKSIRFADRYGISERLDKIYFELKEGGAFCNELANARIIQLIAEIFREEDIVPFASESSAALIRYKNLLGKISESFEFITFSEAAGAMHMTEAYFSRFFKKISGMTFSSYLNIVKIDRAIELLRENPDISTSSLMIECGFNTLRHFNRIFKEVTGYPPKKLPAGYNLSIKTISDASAGFDPTLPSSILL